MKKHECKWCKAREGTPRCYAEYHGEYEFHCTRPMGHKGKHVACGTTMHDIKRWK